MEAALFVFSLIIMLLLLLWSARGDVAGTVTTGKGLFDTRPGADCDERPRQVGFYGNTPQGRL